MRHSHPILNTNTRFIDAASFYGSIKCFRYLLLNGSSIDKNLMDFAISGGNTEIIRLIVNSDEKMKSYIKETAHIAVFFHHYDVYNWIKEANPVTSKEEREAVFITNNLQYLVGLKGKLNILGSLDGVYFIEQGELLKGKSP